MNVRLVCLVAFAAVGSQTTVWGQSKLYSSTGNYENMALGRGLDRLGDIDGDGISEIVISTPSSPSPPMSSGTIRVVSGASGAVLYEIGGTSQESIGSDVAGIGDMNGDGRGDFVSGGRNAANMARVTVFSGVDGQEVYSIAGDSTTLYGRVLANAGDVNADGHDDFIVGAFTSDLGGDESGAAYVYSGVDGTLLHLFVGAGPKDWFGEHVDGIGDVDGDGHADVIVGAKEPGHAFQYGYARVFSGATGAILKQFNGVNVDRSYGTAVAGAGDINGDGVPDVLIAAGGWPSAANRGRVYAYSGADWSVIHIFDGDQDSGSFGYSLSAIGDVDQDGYDDVLICGRDEGNGINGAPGSAHIFSGLSGRELLVVYGATHNADFGWDCTDLGDVNQDGFPDFCVSEIGASNWAGAAVVYSPCPLPAWTYCVTTPNSWNFGALMGSAGTTSVSAADLELTVTDAVGGQLGIFFYGSEPAQNPLGNGRLCVGGNEIYRLGTPLVLDSLGAAQVALDFNSAPVGVGAGAIHPGDTRYFQFWFRDPVAGGAGFNLSNGLAAVFCL